jgi:hypothetical protein
VRASAVRTAAQRGSNSGAARLCLTTHAATPAAGVRPVPTRAYGTPMRSLFGHRLASRGRGRERFGALRGACQRGSNSSAARPCLTIYAATLATGVRPVPTHTYGTPKCDRILAAIWRHMSGEGCGLGRCAVRFSAVRTAAQRCPTLQRMLRHSQPAYGLCQHTRTALQNAIAFWPPYGATRAGNGKGWVWGAARCVPARFEQQRNAALPDNACCDTRSRRTACANTHAATPMRLQLGRHMAPRERGRVRFGVLRSACQRGSN